MARAGQLSPGGPLPGLGLAGFWVVELFRAYRVLGCRVVCRAYRVLGCRVEVAGFGTYGFRVLVSGFYRAHGSRI